MGALLCVGPVVPLGAWESQSAPVSYGTDGGLYLPRCSIDSR